ncbi:hypothetical protein NS365_23320 [Aureimonas ureilytica]|uniref:Uncharacterized protein n=2 Tax=Aureimonas ureilytica TaxID=401562 RepID=A0A175RBD9_9HYPH|nr:hypothetical protein NS365_23320 [Aureimonas ureilytica]
MRCVCIKTPPTHGDGFAVPQMGVVYTVRSVVAVSENRSGMVLLRFFELDNTRWIGERFFDLERSVDFVLTAEPAFRCGYFRPLSETRIDVFRRLLAPTDRVSA